MPVNETHLYAKLPRQPGDRAAGGQTCMQSGRKSARLRLRRAALGRGAGEWRLLLTLSTGPRQ